MFKKILNKNTSLLNVLFLSLIIISILGTISTFLFNFINLSFDFDFYQMIAAAKEISNKKLGGIPFFPNSSLGADILFWPYILSPLIYSIFLDFFTNLYQIHFLIAVEYLIAITLLIFFSFKLLKILNWDKNKVIIYTFFILLFLSPLFNHYFIGGKSAYRLCFIVTLISIYFLINILFNKGNKNTNIFFCGFFSSLTPLSFMSIGLPIFLGIQINFLINNFFYEKKNIKKKYLNLLLFFSGTLTPLIFFLLYFTTYSNNNDAQDLIKLLFLYSNEASPTSFNSFLLKYGYFISSLLVTSYVKVSFLTIFLLSLLINLIKYKDLSPNIKIIIRTLTIFFITWAIIAIPFSTHISAVRISILYPLFICGFINLFLIKFKDRSLLNFFKCFSIFLFFIQIISIPFIRKYDIIILSLFSGITLLIFVIFLIPLFKKKQKFLKNDSKYINFLFYSLCIFLLLKVFYAKNINIIKTASVISENYKLNKKILPNSNYFISTTRLNLAKLVNDNDFVLTNKPYYDFFPNNKLQALFGYRIFYGGVSNKPATKVVIFSNYKNFVNYYENKLDVNTIVYFKGFYYKISDRIKIDNNNYIFYGENINYSGKNYIKSPDFYIKKEDIIKYFEWKEKKLIKLNEN